MGLLDIFRKQKKNPPAAGLEEKGLATLCYGIAYFVLPRRAFEECDQLVKIFEDPAFDAGQYFYFLGSRIQKTKPVREQGQLFRSHHGELDSAHDYYVLEYPKPAPVDFSGIDPVETPPEQLPVLAPHFSAVIRRRPSGTIRYYVLGQSPLEGGTTLRCVTPDGMNCNLGPGPEPDLQAFLARLRAAPGDG